MPDTRRSLSDVPAWWDPLLSSPLLWGSLLTVGFYSALPYAPMHRELLERYLCGHPIEYATTALFFLGMSILVIRWMRFGAERTSLSEELLREDLLSGNDPAERAETIRARLGVLPFRLRRTFLVQRLKDACAYVQGRRTTEGLETHLQYLAQQASDRTHESYGLVRTITWAIPILGFLGTVMGITVAIANITPEQLDSSIGAVTAGLALAFDTTALSLTLSLAMVFTYFVVERAEQRILAAVEDFGTRRILSLFPMGKLAAPASPLAEAETTAARQLLEKTESLIAWQTELWQEALESLRQRWNDTLAQQQRAFDEALQMGMAATLADHAGQLQTIRGEFLEAFEDASRCLTEGLAEGQRGLLQSLGEQVGGWQDQLKASTTTAASQLEELRHQGEILLQIIGREEQLARLQGRLTENLEAVRATGAFDETIHSLTAAIHLLTARAGSKLNAA